MHTHEKYIQLRRFRRSEREQEIHQTNIPNDINSHPQINEKHDKTNARKSDTKYEDNHQQWSPEGNRKP